MRLSLHALVFRVFLALIAATLLPIAPAAAAICEQTSAAARVAEPRTDPKIGAAGLPPGSNGPPARMKDDAAVVQAFERRISDYVALHRLLEGPLPPLQVSNDMDTVRAATDALARQIQAARRNARPGDLFTPDIARMFRTRIATCLTPEDIQAILAEGEPTEPIVVPTLTVNMVWPEDVLFNFVPPQLIAALPPLPPELQYRIIGRSIVLWDHHANLIVDFLPAAFTT